MISFSGLRQHFAEWRPNSGAPLFDLGAIMVRSDFAEEGDERTQRRQRGIWAAGRVLLMGGAYITLRELALAAEEHGRVQGYRDAKRRLSERAQAEQLAGEERAFHAGRHSGWTESCEHWRHPLPDGLAPFRAGQDQDRLRWAGVTEDGWPVDPFRDGPYANVPPAEQPLLEENVVDEGALEQSGAPYNFWQRPAEELLLREPARGEG